MYLVTAILEASICREVIHPGSRVFKAKDPNAIEDPLEAKPLFLPFCAFLNFVFFRL
jgi:hypothetical protein